MLSQPVILRRKIIFVKVVFVESFDCILHGLPDMSAKDRINWNERIDKIENKAKRQKKNRNEIPKSY